MAIKTKKISELNSILLTSDTALEQSDFYMLACQNGVTGKLATKDVIDTIRTIVVKLIEEKVDEDSLTQPQAQTFSVQEIDEIKTSSSNALTELVNLSQKIEDLSVKFKGLSLNFASKFDELQEASVVLSERMTKIESEHSASSDTSSLETRVAALESFVHKLQKDGYLTLAEIRKAAAETCPICTHTHEEVTETPAE